MNLRNGSSPNPWLMPRFPFFVQAEQRLEKILATVVSSGYLGLWVLIPVQQHNSVSGMIEYRKRGLA